MILNQAFDVIIESQVNKARRIRSQKFYFGDIIPIE